MEYKLTQSRFVFYNKDNQIDSAPKGSSSRSKVVNTAHKPGFVGNNFIVVSKTFADYFSAVVFFVGKLTISDNRKGFFDFDTRL